MRRSLMTDPRTQHGLMFGRVSKIRRLPFLRPCATLAADQEKRMGMSPMSDVLCDTRNPIRLPGSHFPGSGTPSIGETGMCGSVH